MMRDERAESLQRARRANPFRITVRSNALLGVGENRELALAPNPQWNRPKREVAMIRPQDLGTTLQRLVNRQQIDKTLKDPSPEPARWISVSAPPACGGRFCEGDCASVGDIASLGSNQDHILP